MRLNLEPVTTLIVFSAVALMLLSFIGEHERQADKLDACISNSTATGMTIK